jgi:hypothetical protein
VLGIGFVRVCFFMFGDHRGSSNSDVAHAK